MLAQLFVATLYDDGEKEPHKDSVEAPSIEPHQH